MGGASIVHPDDCDTKLTAQERAICASLTPKDQQTLTKMKLKDGSPATCEFRAGLIDGFWWPSERAHGTGWTAAAGRSAPADSI